MKPSPFILPASDEERLLLEGWFKARLESGMGNHAFGWSYLDSPQTANRESAHRFVRLDQQLKNMLPHLDGLYLHHLQEYYACVYGPSRFNFLGNLEGPFLEGEASREEGEVDRPSGSLPAP